MMVIQDLHTLEMLICLLSCIFMLCNMYIHYVCTMLKMQYFAMQDKTVHKNTMEQKIGGEVEKVACLPGEF